jgi:hypothetical protein
LSLSSINLRVLFRRLPQIPRSNGAATLSFALLSQFRHVAAQEIAALGNELTFTLAST